MYLKTVSLLKPIKPKFFCSCGGIFFSVIFSLLYLPLGLLNFVIMIITYVFYFFSICVFAIIYDDVPIIRVRAE